VLQQQGCKKHWCLIFVDFVTVQLPIITRFYITLSFFTTAACALEVGLLQHCRAANSNC
jgi:hypothetical protein